LAPWPWITLKPVAKADLVPVHLNSDRVKFQTKDPTAVRFQTLTFQAGARTGWHHHPGFTLVVEGHDFPPNPYVSFDGNIFNTTVVSTTRLEATVPGAALGATPRQVSVLVTRIGGAAQSSNALPFQILPAQDGG